MTASQMTLPATAQAAQPGPRVHTIRSTDPHWLAKLTQLLGQAAPGAVIEVSTPAMLELAQEAAARKRPGVRFTLRLIARPLVLDEAPPGAPEGYAVQVTCVPPAPGACLWLPYSALRHAGLVPGAPLRAWLQAAGTYLQTCAQGPILSAQWLVAVDSPTVTLTLIAWADAGVLASVDPLGFGGESEHVPGHTVVPVALDGAAPCTLTLDRFYASFASAYDAWLDDAHPGSDGAPEPYGFPCPRCGRVVLAATTPMPDHQARGGVCATCDPR